MSNHFHVLIRVSRVDSVCDVELFRRFKILNQEDGQLSKTVMLRCRVRYFTDGAILL